MDKVEPEVSIFFQLFNFLSAKTEFFFHLKNLTTCRDSILRAGNFFRIFCSKQFSFLSCLNSVLAYRSFELTKNFSTSVVTFTVTSSGRQNHDEVIWKEKYYENKKNPAHIMICFFVFENGFVLLLFYEKKVISIFAPNNSVFSKSWRVVNFVVVVALFVFKCVRVRSRQIKFARGDINFESSRPSYTEIILNAKTFLWSGGRGVWRGERITLYYNFHIWINSARSTFGATMQRYQGSLRKYHQKGGIFISWELYRQLAPTCVKNRLVLNECWGSCTYMYTT